MAFTFTPQFEPLDLGSPLWKIKSNRPGEYQLIEGTLAKNDDEFSALSSGSAEDPTTFLRAWERSNKTLAALFEHALNVLDLSSKTVTLLGNLIDPFSPLKIVKDVADVIEEELGSSFSIEVAAVGSPSPMFHWFRLAPDADDWSYLSEGRLQPRDNRSETFTRLSFEEFAPEDVGRYRCQVHHSLPVMSGNATQEPFQGVYSRCVEVKVKTGSIWVKSQTKSTETFVGAPMRLEVDVISLEPVEYQWYRDGGKILNENKSFMSRMAVSADMVGSYSCEVKGSKRTVLTEPINVSMRAPNEKEADALEFLDEEMKIVKQPTYTPKNGMKAGIGDLVSLECLAVAQHRLKYEWLKRGESEDLIETQDDSEGSERARSVKYTRLIPVSHERSMTDRIEESSEVASVSSWTYQCCVTCPVNGQRLLSDRVRVPVSSRISAVRCAPAFKIALVICQDSYAEQDVFSDLNAPRRDGTDLIAKLHDMDFRVLAFTNLSLGEVRNAIDLFAKMIDRTTYALFYYNGHALGSGDDMYLAATDSTLLPGLPIENQLIWRGEVENQLDKCNPLLCVVIYDSCRDAASATMEAAMKRREAITYTSSFVVAFGTSDGMRSYEYSDVSVSQGLYMKHLVRHIDTTESVSSLFESLTDSFIAEESPSITSKMKPEYKIATKQKMCLNTPMRTSDSKFSSLDRTFFNLCRFEPAVAASAAPTFKTPCEFSDQFEVEVGVVCLADNLFEWVTHLANESCHYGVLKVCVGPATFLNEANVSLQFSSRNRDLFKRVKFQILGVNCHLEKIGCEIRAGHSLVESYPPCAKKNDFTMGDGPIFTGNGTCVIKYIQKVRESSIRLRLAMWVSDSKKKDKKCIAHKYVGFPLPLTTNFPGIRMNNLPLKNALI